ncbi:MAG: ribonuclease HI [Elainella sp.]
MVAKSRSTSSAATPAATAAPGLKTIQSVYTDGACSGNPGPGGWGTVIYFVDGSVQELGGGDAQTTNNRMEMQAAIRALEYLVAAEPAPSQPVLLYTDSEYVKNGITQWLTGWKKKGWKTAAGKPVLNQDLWRLLDQLQAQVTAKMTLQWRYVKGHSGDRGNDRCDEIARAFSLGRVPHLRQAGSTPQPAQSAQLAEPRLTEPLQTEPLQTEPLQTEPLPPPLESLSKLVAEAVPGLAGTHEPASEALQSSQSVEPTNPRPVSPPTFAEAYNSSTMIDPLSDIDVPREVKVAQLRNVVDTLQMADEIARQGYLITSSELADLMDVNASAVTSRGDNWIWRNWMISRVRREGNQILWQLERAE